MYAKQAARDHRHYYQPTSRKFAFLRNERFSFLLTVVPAATESLVCMAHDGFRARAGSSNPNQWFLVDIDGV